MIIGAGVEVRIKTYYSFNHLNSAALFTRYAGEIEKTNPTNSQDHRSFVSSAIITAVAFLEAKINEFYLDACENPREINRFIGDEETNTIAKMWTNSDILEKARTLEKYQIALALAKVEMFDKGVTPYQDVESLISLRNELIHYKPQWSIVHSDLEKQAKHKLEKRLTGKFVLNPLTSPGNPFFPDKCLGYGCAKWAVEKSIELAEDFNRKLNIPSDYTHSKQLLS